MYDAFYSALERDSEVALQEAKQLRKELSDAIRDRDLATAQVAALTRMHAAMAQTSNPVEALAAAIDAVQRALNPGEAGPRPTS